MSSINAENIIVTNLTVTNINGVPASAFDCCICTCPEPEDCYECPEDNPQPDDGCYDCTDPPPCPCHSKCTTGPTGPAGPQGIQGATGPAGSTVSMIGGLVTLSNAGDNTNNRYFGAYVASTGLGGTSIETNATTIIPLDCTISHFYVNLSTAPGVGKSYTFTIRKNGVNTFISVPISGDTVISGSDTINTATFKSGDTFTIISVPNDTPNFTEARWSCRLTNP